MANKQQTAVDYFFDKIKSNFEHDGDKLESVMFLYAICKEKEREQHVSAYSHGWHDGQDEIINRIAHIDKGGDEAGLKHFNKTYKGGKQMSNTDPNHPAFACVDANSYLQDGLTKREYFAAMAMQGILAKESFAERLANEPEANNTLRKTVAYASVVMADEIIKELNKGVGNE